MKKNLVSFSPHCLFVLLCFMCGACGGGGDEDPIIEPDVTPTIKIDVSKTSFDVSATEEIITVSFETNAAWNASSSQSWCTLSKTSGNAGKQNMNATITENQETTDRSAIITIKAGNVKKEITVKQQRKESDKPQETGNGNADASGSDFTKG